MSVGSSSAATANWSGWTAVEGVDSGELRLALVAGEPGVGKTRLAAELACHVYEEGATVSPDAATRT